MDRARQRARGAPSLIRVALTGGIATGKSRVLARLAASGVPTIDADRLSRAMLEPGQPALDAVVERFGRNMLDEAGALDRPALARIVFGDERARADLEAIVHPAVYGAIESWFAALEATGASTVAVADIPLLFETGRQGDFDLVVVTTCPADTQVARVVSRDGVSEAEARRRIAAQWPAARRTAGAHYVIETTGTLEDTDRQTDAVLAQLRAEATRAETEGERGER